MQAMEGQFDCCTEDLFNQTWKTECPATKSRSIRLRSSYATPSSCTRSRRESMRISRESLQPWKLMHLVEMKELTALRKKLEIWRKS